MNKLPARILLITLLISPFSTGYCQGQESDIINNVKKLFNNKLPPAGQDKGDTTQFNLNKDEIERMASTLKNPFIPQLPKPKTEPAKTAEGTKPQNSEQPKPKIELPLPKEKPVEIPKPQFQINGLVWDTDQPQAIVDNIVVDVGDYIGQWKVTDISKKGVTFKYQTVEYLIEP